MPHEVCLSDISCRELFTIVIDMLATLIHSTLVSDSQSEKEENRKHYQNLMKKLKKVCNVHLLVMQLL
jgi:mediator of RNA polymerase II transcription subunit 12